MKRTYYRSTLLTWTVRGCAVLALAAGGCTELGDEFRNAAGPSLQTGITQVLNGVVNGAFAVFEPGKDEDGTTGDG